MHKRKQAGYKYITFQSIFFIVLFLLGFGLSSFVSESSNVESNSNWLWHFMGRLHPLIVHFPLSILLFIAALELYAIRNFNSNFRFAISIGLYISAFSAVLSVVFGLLLAQYDDITGDTLDNHKLLGFITSGLCIGSAFLSWLITQKNRVSLIPVYRFCLFIAALGIALTGHFGGSLTHGEDFLTETLPFKEKPTLPSQGMLLAYQSDSINLSAENQLKLVGQVLAIFAHNCYKCHSSNKQEGKLRLDQKDFVYAGGKNGKVIVFGNPEKSELVRRISLPKGHKEAMPGKGNPLKAEEIELIRFWIEKGAPWPANSLQPNLFRVAKMEPRKPEFPKDRGGFDNPIDVWVNSYFNKNKIPWQKPVEDRIYLKRVYLDIIGLLPSPEEMEAFSKDTHPDKKSVLVRKLLNRKEDYTQNWLTFWNDILRNDYSGTGFITNGRYKITDWLYTSLKYNKPYNVFVKELLNPNEHSKGFISGIQWRGTINASQRVEMQAAQNVSQVLLGLNLKCASCHDSFISDWKLADAYAFANVFSEDRLEINRCDKPTGKYADTKLLWQNFGTIDSTATRAKKLEQMANAMVQPTNGRMYRTLVNRIWKQMMGRGIVEPVDEMDNEPWSQDLLDWLAVDFVEKKYDIKELIYLIATSNIYQAASSAYPTQNALFTNAYRFSGMTRRRISAEQFSDAVSQVITPIFELEDVKFKIGDEKKGAYPEMVFPRASLVANNRFLTALGRPNREVVITSRDSQANLLQALELSNGEKLNLVLKRGTEQWQKKFSSSTALVLEIYKRALGRSPMAKELNIALELLGKTPKAEQIQDLFWAILLLPEFQLIY